MLGSIAPLLTPNLKVDQLVCTAKQEGERLSQEALVKRKGYINVHIYICDVYFITLYNLEGKKAWLSWFIYTFTIHTTRLLKLVVSTSSAETTVIIHNTNRITKSTQTRKKGKTEISENEFFHRKCSCADYGFHAGWLDSSNLNSSIQPESICDALPANGTFWQPWAAFSACLESTVIVWDLLY